MRDGRGATFGSRDDVRDAGVEQHLDFVLKLQFLLLESGDRKHVGITTSEAKGNLIVETAMFGPQRFEPDGGLIIVGHRQETAQSE